MASTQSSPGGVFRARVSRGARIGAVSIEDDADPSAMTRQGPDVVHAPKRIRRRAVRRGRVGGATRPPQTVRLAG